VRGSDAFREIGERGAALRDEDQAGGADGHREVGMQERGEVGHFCVDEAFICTDELGKVELRIVNANTKAAAEERLGDFDHAAFAEVVGVCFEGEAEDDDFGLAGLFDQVEEAAGVLFVAGEKVLDERNTDAFAAGAMSECADVFRQAGTAEGISGAKIVGRDVQLFVLAKQRHDGGGVDLHLFAETADFIRESNLCGVKGVAGVLDHFGGLPIHDGGVCAEEGH